MKKSISKTEAQQKIVTFFQRLDFSPDEARKIKRLAMKHRIKLGAHKKQFCKKCLSQLKGRTTKVTKTHKSVECLACGFKNKTTLLSK